MIRKSTRKLTTCLMPSRQKGEWAKIPYDSQRAHHHPETLMRSSKATVCMPAVSVVSDQKVSDKVRDSLITLQLPCRENLFEIITKACTETRRSGCRPCGTRSKLPPSFHITIDLDGHKENQAPVQNEMMRIHGPKQNRIRSKRPWCFPTGNAQRNQTPEDQWFFVAHGPPIPDNGPRKSVSRVDDRVAPDGNFLLVISSSFIKSCSGRAQTVPKCA